MVESTDNDPGWILDNGTRMTVTRINDSDFHIKDRDSKRECMISWTADGSRMLFNGANLEREDFMSFVGLMDDVTEHLGSSMPGFTVDLENDW